MISRLRLFAACLLLLVLPLQGIAVAAGLSAMAHCPMTGSGMSGCCEHGKQATEASAHHPHSQHQQQTHDASPCDTGAGCPALSVLAVPVAAPVLAVAPAGSMPIAAHDLRIRSHFPDGLRRPPRLLA